MNKLKVYLIPALVLVLGAVGMYAFLNMREDQPRSRPQLQARVVETRVVELGPIATDLNAFGTIVSAQPVDLYSEVAGSILPGEVGFRPGQTFEAGDVLARIDDRQVELDRQATISDLLSALANFLPDAKVEFPGEYPVWQAYFNSISFESTLPELPAVSNQRVKLYLSRFGVYKLYFAVRNIEIRLEKHIITAPFNGAIVSAELRPGSTARVGSRLGTILNLAELEVEVPLSAHDIPWVDMERPVAFRSSEFRGIWEGRISRVGRSINQGTQTVPMFVELAPGQAPTLPEGVFLKAAVPGVVVDNAIEVPRRAIYDNQFVYVIRDGRFEYQQVQVARMLSESVVIDGGLAPGDTLVIEPLQGVMIGAPARANFGDAGDGGL